MRSGSKPEHVKDGYKKLRPTLPRSVWFKSLRDLNLYGMYYSKRLGPSITRVLVQSYLLLGIDNPERCKLFASTTSKLIADRCKMYPYWTSYRRSDLTRDLYIHTGKWMRTDIAWTFRLYQGVPILWHLARRSKTAWIASSFTYTVRDVQKSNFLRFDFSVSHHREVSLINLKDELRLVERCRISLTPFLCAKVKGSPKGNLMNPAIRIS